MRKEIRYIAIDGTVFPTEEKCYEYERDLPIIDSNCIVYFSNDGKRIYEPDEGVLLSSNRFMVKNLEGLYDYINFCTNYGLATPDIPMYANFDYGPLHFLFSGGTWMCFEDEIMRLQTALANSYSNEEAPKETYHDLLGDVEQFI